MNVAMTAADLVKWVALGRGRVRRIHGWNAKATDLYIQLHQCPPLADGTLAASTVPTIKSFLAQTENGFSYEFGTGIDFTELTIAISSTEVNYTAVGANGGLDMTIEVDGDLVQTGDTVVGDIDATGASSHTIWANANGPRRLIRFRVLADSIATDQFLMLLAVDSGDLADGLLPVAVWPVTTDTDDEYDMGRNFVPRSGTYDGCLFVLSSTADVLTQTVDTCFLRAITRNE